MRLKLIFFSSLAVGLLVGGIYHVTKANALINHNEDNVTICHWDYGKNAYKPPQTVSDESIYKWDNGKHKCVADGHGEHSKDIIPSFWNGICHFSGLNTDKLSWIGNDCQKPPEITPTPTLTPTPTIKPCEDDCQEPTPPPTPTQTPCREDCEPTVTPTPTPEIETHNEPGSGVPGSGDPPHCTETAPEAAVNPHVYRKGDCAVIKWYPKAGNQANIYYKQSKSESWQYSVIGVPNTGYHEICGLGTMDIDFSVQETNNCSGGQVVSAANLSAPIKDGAEGGHWKLFRR